MGSRRECTRILGLESFRVERVEWEGTHRMRGVCVWIERRGIRGYECSGCRRRTWRVRDYKVRTWDDLPWAEHRVTLVYAQRRVRCRTCGIRTERVGFADGHARITRRRRQLIGVDCQSMPTSLRPCATASVGARPDARRRPSWSNGMAPLTLSSSLALSVETAIAGSIVKRLSPRRDEWMGLLVSYPLAKWSKIHEMLRF